MFTHLSDRVKSAPPGAEWLDSTTLNYLKVVEDKVFIYNFSRKRWETSFLPKDIIFEGYVLPIPTGSLEKKPIDELNPKKIEILADLVKYEEIKDSILLMSLCFSVSTIVPCVNVKEDSIKKLGDPTKLDAEFGPLKNWVYSYKGEFFWVRSMPKIDAWDGMVQIDSTTMNPSIIKDFLSFIEACIPELNSL